MKTLIYSGVIVCSLVAVNSMAAVSGGASAGGGATATGAGAGAAVNTTTTIQQGGAVQTAPTAPNTPTRPFSVLNPNQQNQQNAQSTQFGGSSSNAFAQATTNSNPLLATNTAMNASNSIFFTNQFAALSNLFSTNGFFGTNFAGHDRGFTEFDTTLIFRIRRVVFDRSRELAALSQLIDFLSQNGVVTINGVVPTPELQQTVVSNVTAVPGVVSVNSRLVVDPRAAAIFARHGQPQSSTNLAPTSDRSLGDSRIFSAGSNVFGVRTNRTSSSLPSEMTNRPSSFITTP